MMCKSTDKTTGVCREGLLGSGGIINVLKCWQYVEEIILFYAAGAVLFCQ